VSVALLHYMCSEVVPHHVPHTTVPANRPHRPVSAPPKRSPRAETGQPVGTHCGVRGRRPARRLPPCALAARPPSVVRLQGRALETQPSEWTWHRAEVGRSGSLPASAACGTPGKGEGDQIGRPGSHRASLQGRGMQSVCSSVPRRIADCRERRTAFHAAMQACNLASDQTGMRATHPPSARSGMQTAFRAGKQKARQIPLRARSSGAGCCGSGD
jgi:hypothetical protein